MFYFNNILTLILWLDFLERHFPKQAYKIKNLASNFYIIIYSYIEVQLKKYNIKLYNDTANNAIFETHYEKNEEYEENATNILNEYNKEIWDILNKHRTFEKEKLY